MKNNTTPNYDLIIAVGGKPMPAMKKRRKRKPKNQTATDNETVVQLNQADTKPNPRTNGN